MFMIVFKDLKYILTKFLSHLNIPSVTAKRKKKITQGNYLTILI